MYQGGLEFLDELDSLFGYDWEPITKLEQRMHLKIHPSQAIVWEANAQTLRFRYVSSNVEELFGYPLNRWFNDSTFWGTVLIHPDDAGYAISLCAQATADGRHHNLAYRVITANQQVKRVLDVVRVIRTAQGQQHLRGLMIDITKHPNPDRSFEFIATEAAIPTGSE